MKKIILLATVALACSVSANAQNSYSGSYNRVSVSYNNTNLSMKMSEGGISLDHSVSLNGVGLDYIHGFGLSKSLPLFLETGLKAKYSFGNDSFDDFDGINIEVEDKYKFFTFEVPVNLTYMFGVSSNVTIAPYAGINFKLHASGKVTEKYQGESEDTNVFSKDDMEDTWNRFQMGWQVGVGAYFSDFYLGVGYGTDFIKLLNESKDGMKINTGNLSVSLGYTF